MQDSPLQSLNMFHTKANLSELSFLALISHESKER